MATSSVGPKTALIVGASRGLGLGLARELARRGWEVAATARDRNRAPELKSAADQARGRITIEQVDINEPASADALVGRLAGRRLGFAMINAGVTGPEHQSVDQATPQEIGALMYTNAIAPVRLARRLLPLVADGGTVAFMSSALGSVSHHTSVSLALYSASKAALNSLTRGFAANDASDRQITVLNLHPGWVRTAMGGNNAPLTVEESVRGLADVIEAHRPPGHYFVDYRAKELNW